MSMENVKPAVSFLVPHDLAHPLEPTGQGVLSGFSAVIKDMFDIEGYRTGGGSPHWLDSAEPAVRHSAVVENVLRAGARITGKSICDEFFYSISGVNAHYGAPVNPRAPGRLPGGSSSGSASAVAHGACDFAIGSDTQGSIRVPAAFCGVYGFRPTWGRVDATGAMSMSEEFDVVGWMSNAPGLMPRIGSALLTGPAQRLTRAYRVLVVRELVEQADSPIQALFDTFLAHAGLERENMSLSLDEIDRWREAIRTVQAFETWETYGRFIIDKAPDLGPGIRERMRYASEVHRDAWKSQRAVVIDAREWLRQLLTPGTVLALPTTPCVPPLLDIAGADLEDFRLRTMRLTCIAGVGGLPQLAIPFGTCAGLPVSISLIGAAHSDEALLEEACRLSRYCGFSV